MPSCPSRRSSTCPTSTPSCARWPASSDRAASSSARRRTGRSRRTPTPRRRSPRRFTSREFTAAELLDLLRRTPSAPGSMASGRSRPLCGPPRAPAAPSVAHPRHRARFRVPDLRDRLRSPAGTRRLRARGPLSDRRMPQGPVTARRVAVVVPTWNGRAGSIAVSARSGPPPIRCPPSSSSTTARGRDGRRRSRRASPRWPSSVIAGIEGRAGSQRGHRAALERGAEFVAVVNQDTWADPSWLTPLMRVAAADPRIGVVTPVQYDYEGRTVEPAQAGLLAAAGSREFIETPQVIGAVLPPLPGPPQAGRALRPALFRLLRGGRPLSASAAGGLPGRARSSKPRQPLARPQTPRRDVGPRQLPVLS